MQKEPVNSNRFEQELRAVHQELMDAAAPLFSPLDLLVRQRIEQATPYPRAAVVLAAAVGRDTDDGQWKGVLQQQRIHLAAAIEMLYVAHNIHKLLLTADSDIIDRSTMGSTILAGDYCFSQSAMLAASTDSPEVVAIFAQALKSVSEDNLRHLFDEADYNNENEELFVAGIEAAAVLANLSDEEKSCITGFAVDLSKVLDLARQPLTEEAVVAMPGIDRLPTFQQHRWRLLLREITASGSNGTAM